MNDHQHDGEEMTLAQMQEHILGMHEGVSASGAAAFVFEQHAADHTRAMREVLALAGHSVPVGMAAEGMPRLRVDVAALQSALIPERLRGVMADGGSAVRGGLREAVERLAREHRVSKEEVEKILAEKGLVGDDVPATDQVVLMDGVPVVQTEHGYMGVGTAAALASYTPATPSSDAGVSISEVVTYADAPPTSGEAMDGGLYLDRDSYVTLVAAVRMLNEVLGE